MDSTLFGFYLLPPIRYLNVSYDAVTFGWHDLQKIEARSELGPAKGMRWPMKRVGVWDSTHFLIPLWSIDYSMSTTVEVKRATAKLLEEIKQKYQARSYDETIRKLIDKAEFVPD